jgi:hypothetical protein
VSGTGRGPLVAWGSLPPRRRSPLDLWHERNFRPPRRGDSPIPLIVPLGWPLSGEIAAASARYTSAPTAGGFGGCPGHAAGLGWGSSEVNPHDAVSPSRTRGCTASGPAPIRPMNLARHGVGFVIVDSFASRPAQADISAGQSGSGVRFASTGTYSRSRTNRTDRFFPIGVRLSGNGISTRDPDTRVRFCPVGDSTERPGVPSRVGERGDSIARRRSWNPS